MKISLLKNLDNNELKELNSSFKSGLMFRKRLNKVLADKIESFRVKTSTSNLYESPSWAYIQADSIGYERALREVISLLSEEI